MEEVRKKYERGRINDEDDHSFIPRIMLLDECRIIYDNKPTVVVTNTSGCNGNSSSSNSRGSSSYLPSKSCEEKLIKEINEIVLGSVALSGTSNGSISTPVLLNGSGSMSRTSSGHHHQQQFKPISKIHSSKSLLRTKDGGQREILLTSLIFKHSFDTSTTTTSATTSMFTTSNSNNSNNNVTSMMTPSLPPPAPILVSQQQQPQGLQVQSPPPSSSSLIASLLALSIPAKSCLNLLTNVRINQSSSTSPPSSSTSSSAATNDTTSSSSLSPTPSTSRPTTTTTLVGVNMKRCSSSQSNNKENGETNCWSTPSSSAAPSPTKSSCSSKSSTSSPPPPMSNGTSKNMTMSLVRKFGLTILWDVESFNNINNNSLINQHLEEEELNDYLASINLSSFDENRRHSKRGRSKRRCGLDLSCFLFQYSPLIDVMIEMLKDDLMIGLKMASSSSSTPTIKTTPIKNGLASPNKMSNNQVSPSRRNNCNNTVSSSRYLMDRSVDKFKNSISTLIKLINLIDEEDDKKKMSLLLVDIIKSTEVKFRRYIFPTIESLMNEQTLTKTKTRPSFASSSSSSFATADDVVTSSSWHVLTTTTSRRRSRTEATDETRKNSSFATKRGTPRQAKVIISSKDASKRCLIEKLIQLFDLILFKQSTTTTTSSDCLASPKDDQDNVSVSFRRQSCRRRRPTSLTFNNNHNNNQHNHLLERETSFSPTNTVATRGGDSLRVIYKSNNCQQQVAKDGLAKDNLAKDDEEEEEDDIFVEQMKQKMSKTLNVSVPLFLPHPKRSLTPTSINNMNDGQLNNHLSQSVPNDGAGAASVNNLTLIYDKNRGNNIHYNNCVDGAHIEQKKRDQKMTKTSCTHVPIIINNHNHNHLINNPNNHHHHNQQKQMTDANVKDSHKRTPTNINIINYSSSLRSRREEEISNQEKDAGSKKEEEMVSCSYLINNTINQQQVTTPEGDTNNTITTRSNLKTLTSKELLISQEKDVQIEKSKRGLSSSLSSHLNCDHGQVTTTLITLKSLTTINGNHGNSLKQNQNFRSASSNGERRNDESSIGYGSLSDSSSSSSNIIINMLPKDEEYQITSAKEEETLMLSKTPTPEPADEAIAQKLMKEYSNLRFNCSQQFNNNSNSETTVPKNNDSRRFSLPVSISSSSSSFCSNVLKTLNKQKMNKKKTPNEDSFEEIDEEEEEEEEDAKDDDIEEAEDATETLMNNEKSNKLREGVVIEIYKSSCVNGFLEMKMPSLSSDDWSEFRDSPSRCSSSSDVAKDVRNEKDVSTAKDVKKMFSLVTKDKILSHVNVQGVIVSLPKDKRRLSKKKRCTSEGSGLSNHFEGTSLYNEEEEELIRRKLNELIESADCCSSKLNCNNSFIHLNLDNWSINSLS